MGAGPGRRPQGSPGRGRRWRGLVGRACAGTSAAAGCGAQGHPGRRSRAADRSSRAWHPGPAPTVRVAARACVPCAGRELACSRVGGRAGRGAGGRRPRPSFRPSPGCFRAWTLARASFKDLLSLGKISVCCGSPRLIYGVCLIRPSSTYLQDTGSVLKTCQNRWVGSPGSSD